MIVASGILQWKEEQSINMKLVHRTGVQSKIKVFFWGGGNDAKLYKESKSRFCCHSQALVIWCTKTKPNAIFFPNILQAIF